MPTLQYERDRAEYKAWYGPVKCWLRFCDVLKESVTVETYNRKLLIGSHHTWQPNGLDRSPCKELALFNRGTTGIALMSSSTTELWSPLGVFISIQKGFETPVIDLAKLSSWPAGEPGELCNHVQKTWHGIPSESETVMPVTPFNCK